MKKILNIVALTTLTLGLFLFNGMSSHKAFAYVDKAGTPMCDPALYPSPWYNYTNFGTIESGVLQGTVSWKYSQGTCYADAVDEDGDTVDDPVFNITVGTTNPSINQGYLMYLDRWDPMSATWNEVGHTGSDTDGQRLLTTNNYYGPYGIQHVAFTREYSGTLTKNQPYRIRFSLPTAGDWTTTSFYTKNWFRSANGG
jgi:hypothetical protein